MVWPGPPDYLMIARDETLAAEYEAGVPIDKMFSLSSSGVKSNRDGLTIAITDDELTRRMNVFVDAARSDVDVADALELEDKKYWTVGEARARLTTAAWQASYTTITYRPFDSRRIVYHPAVVHSTRKPVMSQLGRGDNLALLLCRQQIVPGFHHVFITRAMFDCCLVSNRSRENTSGFPLYSENGRAREPDPRMARRRGTRT